VLWWNWMLWFSVVSLYISCLLTMCSMAFQQERNGLGNDGIAPHLWLAGAFLPAKKGPRYVRAQQMAYQRHVARYGR
jgi:hypothetical protein